MLNARAIALRGIGFSARLVGLRGLWPTTEPTAPEDGGGGGPRGGHSYLRNTFTNDDDDVIVILQSLFATGAFDG
jgi:hypothetical protein